MSSSNLICQNKDRRHEVRRQQYYGFDYLEVQDGQRTLKVYFLGKAPAELTPKHVRHVRIEGGRRIRNIHVTGLEVHRQQDPNLDDYIKVAVDRCGDFSTYTLRMVALDKAGHPTGESFPNFDPRYDHLEFTFKAGLPSDLDCKEEMICPPKQYPDPEINYLAKDYASFRQLILDRLALIMPDWQERHIPDIGITLVEILAYVGDYLSYYQDAVGSEAYLDTARQRISVRRHARLVDYQMHEGCNARAWVSIETKNNVLGLDPKKIYFITGYNNPLLEDSHLLTTEDLHKRLSTSQYEIFEPLLEKSLHFRPGDFVNLEELVAKLCAPQPDALSRYIWRQLSAELQSKLLQHPESEPWPDELRQALVDELNMLLEDVGLYAEGRLAGVKVDECDLDWQNLQGQELLNCNHLLLETAYPGDIRSSRHLHLYADHSEIQFYTWGDRDCCLPRGATTATLKGQWAFTLPSSLAKSEPEQAPTSQKTPDTAPTKPPSNSIPAPILHLQAGDVLIFEEIKGPKTGNSADADPAHRHAVRLTRVEAGYDDLYQQPVVEITWAEEDALPFSLCIATIVPGLECAYENISVARGNVILVNHGWRIEAEDLGQVMTETSPAPCLDEGQPGPAVVTPVRFRPYLQKSPLVFSQPLPVNAPATGLLSQDPRQALPWIWLTENETGSSTSKALTAARTSLPSTTWQPQRDLLNCRPGDTHFVAEVDNEGRGRLRFGDGELGRLPAAGTRFAATYRVGGGTVGNVGAKAISHIIQRPGFTLSGVIFSRIWNPFPARGGTNPEPITDVKQFASHAFRTDLKRAIIADDYAHLAKQHPKVQRAAAKLRWTGSWYEVLVVIDPWGQAEADEALLNEIAGYLYPYHRMGHDVLVEAARYVPLDITMRICVKPNYLNGHVKAALLARFSNRVLPNSERGFFHPDNLTFGEGVMLSNLVAVAQTVPGVESVRVSRFQRLFEETNNELKNGILPLGPLEIARLDRDPNFPENGQLELIMEGGR